MADERRRVQVWMDIDDVFSQSVIRGVFAFARRGADWRLVGQGWMLPPAARHRVDGVIARLDDPAAARRAAGLGVPVVDVAGAFLRSAYWSVTNDEEATGRLAGEHLLLRAFRHFAFCGVRGAAWSDGRRAGFAAATGARRPPAFARPLAWWKSASPSPSLSAWLSALPLPCGLLAASDTVGLRVARTAQAAGLRVPEDLALVGVDNETVLCRLSEPTLSSIPSRGERIGYQAAATLAAILDGRPPPRTPGRATVTIPPGPLVARESSATVATGDALVQAALAYWRAGRAHGVNVKETLAHLGVARRTLGLRFRAAFGRTPHAVLADLRLERARELLRSGLTAAAAGKTCGFSSPQAFHRAFRRRFGHSPGTADELRE